MPEHEPDLSLVHAARSGDRAAFSRLYAKFAPMVHAVLLARVKPAEADDLVQDVFLRAMSKLDTLADPNALGAWLAAIARNAAAAFHRSSRPRPELPDTVADHAPTAPTNAEANEAMEAIRSLPETYRETLLMRLVEGLSGPEIAARTGMTPGSVRVNLHRGMALLRERLGADSRAPSAAASPSGART